MRCVFHFVLSFILITNRECCWLLWQWVGFVFPFKSGAVSWVVSELLGTEFPTFSNGVLALYRWGSVSGPLMAHSLIQFWAVSSLCNLDYAKGSGWGGCWLPSPCGCNQTHCPPGVSLSLLQTEPFRDEPTGKDCRLQTYKVSRARTFSPDSIQYMTLLV